jgi:hypothetical protein
MPTLIGTPARQSTTDYAFSVANVVPSMLTSGAVDATTPVYSAFDPVYRDALTDSVAITIQQIQKALSEYVIREVSLADLVFMEEPDDGPAYQDAFEWQPVTVRIVLDRESGYVGGDDVWR